MYLPLQNQNSQQKRLNSKVSGWSSQTIFLAFVWLDDYHFYMYVSNKQVSSSKVFDSEGHPLGKVHRALIDPANGQLLAFQIHTGKPNLVAPRDVVTWKRHYLILGQDYELHQPDDIIRVYNLLHSRHPDLKGKKVVTETGIYVGKVTEYSLNTTHFMLASITTYKSFLGVFRHDHRLIHQSSILEIKTRKIIVRDSLLKISIHQNIPGKLDLQNSPTFDQALFGSGDRTFP